VASLRDDKRQDDIAVVETSPPKCRFRLCGAVVREQIMCGSSEIKVREAN
jgi:hypothetical protein